MIDLSENFAAMRGKLGLSRTALAQKIGVSADKIKHVETGHQRADHELLFALRSVLGIDLNDLIGLPDEHQENWQILPDAEPSSFAQIPRYQVEASAGCGALVEAEETSGSYAFNLKWLARRGLKPSHLCVISVRGDSMEPRLADGDLILVDRAQRQIADGLAYVMRIDNDLIVKNIQRVRPGVIALLSANTLYPPRELDLENLGPDAEVIGRVVASMQEW